MNKTVKSLFWLHCILMIYSVSGILSKKASSETILSLPFCLFYGGVIFLMFFYAVGWQQVIKNIPLTLAFANKAVTVIWGIIWGAIFFSETITIGKIIGAICVVVGVILFSYSDEIKK